MVGSHPLDPESRSPRSPRAVLPSDQRCLLTRGHRRTFSLLRSFGKQDASHCSPASKRDNAATIVRYRGSYLQCDRGSNGANQPVDELWDSFREEVGAELFAVAALNSEIDCRMTPLTGRPDATPTPITPDVRFFLQPRRMHRFHHSFHSRFALAPSHPARLRSCLLVQRPR